MILRRTLRLFKFLAILVAIISVIAGTYLWFEGNNLITSLTPRIQAELGRNLNAKVTISDLKLALFPRFGITMNSFSLKPEDSCGEISAQRGLLYIDFFALIRGEYIINYISLTSARASVAISNGDIKLIGEAQSNCDKADVDARPPTPNPNSHDSPIQLKLKKLVVDDLALSVKGAHEHKLVVSHLRSGASLENGRLTLKAPHLEATFDLIPVILSANSAQVELNAPTSISLDTGNINIADQTLQIGGTFQQPLIFKDIKFTATNIHLSKVSEFLKALESNAPQFTSGIATLSATLNSSQETGVDATADVKLADINVPTLQLKFAELGLQSGSYKRLTGEDWQTAANFMLRKFSIVDGKDSYEVGKVVGPIKFKKESANQALTGQLTVTAFGFKDGLTDLRNVSARLDEIDGKFSANGESKVTTNLEGSSLELVHPSIEIRRIANMTAPITVKISRGGKYSVSGLVAAKGGNSVISSREFSDMNLSIQTLISGALKTFDARDISAKLMGRALSSKGTFTMSPAFYALKGFQTSLKTGNLTVNGNINRDRSRAYSAEASVKNIPIADLVSCAKGAEAKLMDGTIAALQTSVKGSMAEPLKSLTGSGSFQLVGTKMQGFDLSRAVGSALSAIPFANIKLSPDNLTDDGRTKTLQAEFSIADQSVNFSKATIYRPKYTIHAQGNIDFEQQIDAKASVVFAQETFKTLGAGFTKLSNLMGRIGKVEIPIFVKGKIPDISIKPDLATLARDNSGITLVGDVIGAVKDIISSPFGSKKKSNEDPSPSPAASN